MDAKSSKKAKKKSATKVQYYKIINTRGHNGLVYHLGKNFDPDITPLSRVGSCQPGAIYFTKAEYLYRFISHGSKIAWVKPIGYVKRDSEGDKWKAKGIEITQMLSFKEALPLIYDGTNAEELVLMYDEFHLRVPKEIIENLSLESQWKYYAEQSTSIGREFLKNNTGNQELVQIVLKTYNKGYCLDDYSEQFVLIWLLENGVDFLKLSKGDLFDLFSDNAQCRKFLKNLVGEISYKLIHLFAGW